MACSFYNNGGFGCGGCTHFYRSTSIALAGTTLTITIPSVTLKNRERLCICLSQNLPEGITPDTIVNIAVTGVTTPFELLSRCGNKVYGDQLRNRTVLHTYALNDLPALQMTGNSNLCPTEHAFTTIIPVTAATPATGAKTGDDTEEPTT